MSKDKVQTKTGHKDDSYPRLHSVAVIAPVAMLKATIGPVSNKI
jgi:hypothetical protein